MVNQYEGCYSHWWPSPCCDWRYQHSSVCPLSAYTNRCLRSSSYETGKSRETDLTFSQSWKGYKMFHDEFIHWLCSVYCKWNLFLFPKEPCTHEHTAKEEIAQRKDPSTRPDHTTTPNPSIPSDLVDDTHSAPNVPTLPPSPSGEPSLTPEQTHNKPPDCPAPQLESTLPKTSQWPSSSPTTQDRPPMPLSQSPVTTPPPSPPKGANGDRQEPPKTVPLLSSHSHLNELIPPIIPTSDGADQSANEADSLVNSHDHSGRAPPPVGVLTFKDTSPFVTVATIAYLQTIPTGLHWVDMVTSYLHLEGSPIAKGVSNIFSYILSYWPPVVPHASSLTLGTRTHIPSRHIINTLWRQTTLDHNVPSD